MYTFLNIFIGNNWISYIQIGPINVFEQLIRRRILQLNVADVPSFATWRLFEFHRQHKTTKLQHNAADIRFGAVTGQFRIIGQKYVCLLVLM